MNESFQQLASIIRHRRTTKPGNMNGGVIPDEQIRQLLELANWAPNHGNTEPWRFAVYAGPQKVARFCEEHAALYRQHTAPESFVQGNYDKLLHMGDKASHVLLAWMQRGPLPKIPALEEIAATAAAIQNLLLGAQALGIAAYWGSGGMTLKPAMKEYLGLGAEDQLLGALYLGYADGQKEGQRGTAGEAKAQWM